MISDKLHFQNAKEQGVFRSKSSDGQKSVYKVWLLIVDLIEEIAHKKGNKLNYCINHPTSKYNLCYLSFVVPPVKVRYITSLSLSPNFTLTSLVRTKGMAMMQATRQRLLWGYQYCTGFLCLNNDACLVIVYLCTPSVFCIREHIFWLDVFLVV